MDVREKLVELIKEGIRKGLRAKGDDRLDYSFEDVADYLISNGVTVQERLVAKQVVIDKKYKSTRCPSCNAVLGASSHYCWQCGQKVTHNLPQPPKGE